MVPINFAKLRFKLFVLALFVLFFLIGVVHHAYVSWRGGL